MSGCASCEIVPLADALARDGGDPVHEPVDGEHPVLPEVQRLAVPGLPQDSRQQLNPDVAPVGL